MSLFNTGQEDLIINSTEEDIIRHLELCKKNSISSNLITKNIASCLYAFGKTELADKIIDFLNSFEDPSTVRNSCQEGAEKFSSDESVEHKYFKMCM